MTEDLEKMLQRFRTSSNECLVSNLQKAFNWLSKKKQDFPIEEINYTTYLLWNEAKFKCKTDRSINLYRQSNGDWDKDVYAQAKSLMNSIADNKDNTNKINELVGQIDNLLKQTTSIATSLQIRTSLSKLLYKLNVKEETPQVVKQRVKLSPIGQFINNFNSIAIEDIPIVEVDSITDEEIEKENVKTFELEDNQLFRFKIYKTPSQTILFSDVHHIITDGESLDNLFNNISNAYDGKELEKETIDGYLNSIIEKENEKSEHYELSKKYFQDQLSHEVDSTILTPDLNGDQEKGILKPVSKNIDPNEISEFCSNTKISPNVLVMASTILTLNKYTFSDKTLLTTIFNGRANPNYYNTQAFLVKTLPIVSINENRNQTVKEFLKQISDIWKDTINYSDYPYANIAEEFKLKPEFFYAYHNLDSEKIEINNKTYEVEYVNTVETNYKIVFDVNETKDNESTRN